MNGKMKGDEPSTGNPEGSAQPLAQHTLREAAARAICRSGRFETGEGTCAVLCMDQLGEVRKKGCGHVERVHGKLADEILSAIAKAEQAAGQGLTEASVDGSSLQQDTGADQ